MPIHPKPGDTDMAPSATASAKPGAEAKVKDAIDKVRSEAQDLHKQISAAAAKTSGATKADIAALTEKAKGAVQSAKASIDTTARQRRQACDRCGQASRGHRGQSV